MLILSRRPDESIFIGDEVVVTILSIKGKQARIGIGAPESLNIIRPELASHGHPGFLLIPTEKQTDTVTRSR